MRSPATEEGRDEDGLACRCRRVWWAKPRPTGSSVNRAGVDEDGDSSLHPALRNPEVTAPAVHALLESGADPMARNQSGNTPLHIAADWTDNVAIIEALLVGSADPSTENEDGHRPVDPRLVGADWGAV